MLRYEEIISKVMILCYDMNRTFLCYYKNKTFLLLRYERNFVDVDIRTKHFICYDIAANQIMEL